MVTSGDDPFRTNRCEGNMISSSIRFDAVLRHGYMAEEGSFQKGRGPVGQVVEGFGSRTEKERLPLEKRRY